MCNAKNHLWNCGCGFGGKELRAKRTQNEAQVLDLFFVPRIPRHYTKPNARCPICGACVYFFSLENKGRVYFDEIGAPWPKHPCTDLPADSSLAPSGDVGLPLDLQGNAWARGWTLLTNVSVDVSEGGTLLLSGLLGGVKVTAFVRDDVFGGEESPGAFLQDSFIQTKPCLNSGQFELALFTPDLRPMLVIGYATAAEAASSRAN